MIFKPHDYQSYCIEYIKAHPIAALLLDMGLGKTVITLTAVRDLMLDTCEVNKVLVIAPLRVARDNEERKRKIRERYKGVDRDALELIPAREIVSFNEDTSFKRVAAYCRVSTTTVGKPTKRTTSTQSASSRPTAASLADISPTSTAGTRTRWKVWMPVDVSKSSTILRRHSTTSTKAKPRHPTSAQSSNTRRTAAGRR